MNDTELTFLLLLLYLGGAGTRPPEAPKALRAVADVQPSRDADELFRVLTARASEAIPRNLGPDHARSRLACRWAAQILRDLAAVGRLKEGDVEPYLHHLADARNVREAAASLLTLMPDLSTHALKLITGASAMTVGRARDLVSGTPD